MNFSAVILAGGKSSRMGRDKAFLSISGKTMLARQIETVRAAGAAEIFISGRAETNYSEFGCRVLVDKFHNAGPLAGIEAALAAATQSIAARAGGGCADDNLGIYTPPSFCLC